MKGQHHDPAAADKFTGLLATDTFAGLRQGSDAICTHAVSAAKVFAMPPKYLERPTARLEEADAGVALPYAMTAEGVVAAVNDIYAYLHALNTASVEYGYGRLEELMQPAGYSGLLSQLICASLAKQFANSKPGLAVNQFPNGRPDLVPRAVYPQDAVLRGEEGVEVKVTRSAASWQGHNPETGWICVFQIGIDLATLPIYDRPPMTIDRVLIAGLDESDWNFSGRSETSRRTPTASINQKGRTKLLVGMVYQRRSVEVTPLPEPPSVE
jgi:hypothetical protein